MKNRKLILLLNIVLFVPVLSLAGPADDSFALRGATLHDGVNPPVGNATVVVENGKISAAGVNVTIPTGVRIIDVKGKVVIPGLIDNHSHLGVYDSDDANEFPQPIGPENRALDALHLEVSDWEEAVRGGVTTIITGPGSGERLSGQSMDTGEADGASKQVAGQPLEPCCIFRPNGDRAIRGKATVGERT